MNKYTDIIKNLEGSMDERFKQLIELHSDKWNLADDNLIIDILDDQTLTADDIFDAMHSLMDIEEIPNKHFKQAVLAMELAVKRSKVGQDVSVEVIDTVKDDQGVIASFIRRDNGLSQGLTSLV